MWGSLQETAIRGFRIYALHFIGQVLDGLILDSMWVTSYRELAKELFFLHHSNFFYT